MENQFYNFNYDPSKEGFDSATWRNVYGDFSVVNGKLQFTQGSIIHYGDILRGDATFNINIATLSDGDTTFGFTQYSKGTHAFFKINGLILSAETSDGVTTKSIVIPWNNSWTDTDTEFRIKWEAGLVTFFIGGQFMASIGYSAPLNIVESIVPNDPMSLFITSDSIDLFILNYITVVGIQSFLMSEGNNNSIFEPFIKETSRVHISDVVIIDSLVLTPININNLVTITEVITVSSPV
jgi:hypothetical protein